MERPALLFEALNDTQIVIKLLESFFMANAMMLRRDISEIRRDVSERSICANLKEPLNFIIRCANKSHYYTDVEYNRGNERLIKTIHIENEDKPIQCDLIIHSRGEIKTMDNLLCLEMKKKSGNVGDDRQRLCELTRPEFHCTNKAKGGITPVYGYKLGIFLYL